MSKMDADPHFDGGQKMNGDRDDSKGLSDYQEHLSSPHVTPPQLRGEVPVTQFGRMCQKLGIRILAASSPQAKGRVERNHGTHQDRLIKKLRRKQIASYEAANQYLESECGFLLKAIS